MDRIKTKHSKKKKQLKSKKVTDHKRMTTFHPKTHTPSIRHKSTPIIATHSPFQPLEQRVHSVPQQQREPNVHQLVDIPHAPPSKNSSTDMSQVIAPIISVCGGIAIVAAVMFFVTLKRKRQRQVRNNESKDDQNKFDDISLSKEGAQPKEEASIPKLAPLRQSMTDTLIESNTTTAAGSRTSSMTLANQPRPKSSASSSSTVYADALSSPAASIKSPRPSFLVMMAERQQLQHERPNIIQTYKAQLSSNILLLEEEPVLPFHYYSCIHS